MKNLFTVFLFLITSLTIEAQLEYTKKELKYKPKTLEEAVDQLHKIHHDTLKQQILSMTEEEFLGSSHFGLGMWIRNNWGLWRGKELYVVFSEKGINHPDYISGIILSCYYKDLKGEEWSFSDEINKFNTHQLKYQEHSYKNDSLNIDSVRFTRDSMQREY